MTTSESVFAELAAIDTPTLINAIERLDVRNRATGFCDRTMRCLFPDLGVMCGYAVTAEVETMRPESTGSLNEPFFELCEQLKALPGPGVVVLKEIGPQVEFSAHCGEVMATVFTRLGAKGLVTDGAVRDLPEVHAMGFRYFAPGVVASHGNFRLVRTNVPVTIHGLRIHPGDLLHGDANGLISIPEEGRERLKALAADITREERNVMDFVKSDVFSIDELKKMFTH